jgi:mycothiol synthase
MSARALEVRICPASRHAEALAVLHRHAPEPIRRRRVAEALAEVAAGRLDLAHLFIAQRGAAGRIVGALMAQRLAGRAAALWPPEVAAALGRATLAARLVEAAVADFAAGGARLAQALLDPAAPPRAGADLARGGLPRVTELLYLERASAPAVAVPAAAPPLDWRGYAPERDAEFRAVLEDTYIGSLDMPELDGARDLGDVMAGHQAAGRFDPNLWRLGRVPGEPSAAAVVLMAENAERRAVEIAYLGLTPPARRRGLGRAALAHALQWAAPRRGRVELAVDVRNEPALRLYRAAGFLPFHRRVVHLKVLQSS